MTSFSVVSLSELKPATRLDADRYRPEFLDLEARLSHLKNMMPLKSVIRKPVRTGRTPKDRGITPSSGKVSFIKTDTLREGSILFENVGYLSPESVRKSDYLGKNDVIVTIIGATFEVIGRAAIFLEEYPASVINQNIAVIRVKEDEMNPYFLTVFLNSKYGRKQFYMISRQTEQVNLNCREVETVLVPRFSKDFQDEIESSYRKVLKEISKAKTLYQQAEELFLKETGLLNLGLSNTKTYIRTFSRTSEFNRIDAEYFQPFYDEIVKKVKQSPNGFTALTDTVKSVHAEFDPAKNADMSLPYVELADIESSIGVIGSSQHVTIENAPSRAGRILKESDVLVPRVEGSLGQVAIVSKDYDGALASTGFFQLRGTTLEPEVLLAILKSRVIQLLLKREATGTILTSIPEPAINRIIIPTVINNTRKTITKLVRQSHDHWRVGQSILSNAKKAVDLAIEEKMR